MAQIKQLKDTSGNFYPVTHKDAIVGIEDIQVDMTGYATELWVEELNYLKEHQDISGKVDKAEFQEASRVTAASLNDLNLRIINLDDQVAPLVESIAGKQDTIADLEEIRSKANSALQEHLDISGKVDIADFEEATLVTAEALNYFNEQLAQKDVDIQTLQEQVAELLNQIATLIGHYNELENIIG